MSYLIYKEAAGKEDKSSANREALIKALGALGGGTAGYLLTRYGLGLKGGGAGLVGAGLGAAAGYGATEYIRGAGKAEAAKQKEDLKKYEENKAALERGFLGNTWRYTKDPKYTLSGAATGGLFGSLRNPQRHLDATIEDAAGQMQEIGTDKAKAEAFKKRYAGKLSNAMKKKIREEAQKGAKIGTVASGALAGIEKTSPAYLKGRARILKALLYGLGGAAATPIGGAVIDEFKRPEQRKFIEAYEPPGSK